MMDRRSALTMVSSTVAAPHVALVASAREVTWQDLVPPGVPYAQIIGEGEMDTVNDLWTPAYDAKGVKLNESLDGAYIKMPGFITPLDVSTDGVRDFMLVPYVGACIQTPPPPENQLVVVKAAHPWPDDELWDPVWVFGEMHTRLQSTGLVQTGYFLSANKLETYIW